MATKFKTIFEVAEEKAMEKGTEKGKAEERAIAATQIQNAVQVLVQATDFTDAQISGKLNVAISLVEKIRKELNLNGLK